MVARLSPGSRHGRVFGGYGAFKSLGYALGPVLGGLLITTGGYRSLFTTLTVLAGVVTVWAALAVPTVPALPRRRQTVLDLVRRLGGADFLRPTITLASATAALAVGVGFLPVLGGEGGLTPLVTGAAVSMPGRPMVAPGPPSPNAPPGRSVGRRHLRRLRRRPPDGVWLRGPAVPGDLAATSSVRAGSVPRPRW
jgi:MFS family permease